MPNDKKRWLIKELAQGPRAESTAWQAGGPVLRHKLCPPKIQIWKQALASNVTVFGDRAMKEVISINEGITYTKHIPRLLTSLNSHLYSLADTIPSGSLGRLPHALLASYVPL